MVAAPNLTLTVTPPGGNPTDYTRYLTWSGANNQMTITQNFGRQGDTAVFPLTEEHSGTPTLAIPVMSRVSLYDHTAAQNLFAGVVNDPVLCVLSPNLNEWDLNCTDYTWYADNAIVHGIFYGWTVDQIIVSLVEQANCGITAKTTANGGFVAPGPQLASYVLNYNTLSTAWRQLATLAGSSSPYGWYVDQNRALHFFDSTTAQPSGVTFTTIPTAPPGSLTEGHIKLDSPFTYEWDGTSVKNKILVQGANQTMYYGSTSNTPTDTWRADGTQSAWPLKFTATGTPVLSLNGVSTSVTLVTSGQTSSTAWNVQQNSIGAWFLTAQTAPAAGTIIRTWYNYQVPVVAQASDPSSQAEYTGPNGGIYAEYISDSTLTTVPMALARAQRERTEYSFAAERMTFDTTEDWFGWVRAGQTCTIDNTLVPDMQAGGSLGVNDTFIVVANTVTFVEDGGYRSAEITAVRV